MDVDLPERKNLEQEIKKGDKDLSVPLSVKCDQEQTNTRINSDSNRSKLNETLSPAIWPTFADLIEDTPQIEDADGEDPDAENQQTQRDVNIDRTELEKVLTQAVSVTRGCSVLSLMDLYGQLNRVSIKYVRSYDRNNLPQELQREISRFQEIQKRPTSSSSLNSNAAS